MWQVSSIYSCISYFLVSMRKDWQVNHPSPASLTSSVLASFRCLLQTTQTNFQVRVNPASCGFPHVSSQSCHTFSAKGYQPEIKKSEWKTWCRNLWSWNSSEEFPHFWVGCFILDKTLSLLKVATNCSSGFEVKCFKTRIFRQLLAPIKIWKSDLLSCALSSLVTEL